MNINEIRSAEWGISLNGIGKVVEGNDDINQCIGIIIRTIKGTDPFRPNFGCDLLRYIDVPQRLAAPGMAKEIADALALWEPRIDVRVVSYRIEESRILFSVDWRLIGSNGSTINSLIDYYYNNISDNPIIPELPTILLTSESYEVIATEDEEFLTA